jgi:hypothetical protein
MTHTPPINNPHHAYYCEPQEPYPIYHSGDERWSALSTEADDTSLSGTKVEPNKATLWLKSHHLNCHMPPLCLNRTSALDYSTHLSKFV